MTLVELLVTMSLLLVVGAMFMTILASVQKGVVRQSDRSNDNDQARLAVQELDREIRSGNVLYDPAAEPAPFVAGYSLRVYTQTNASTRTPGNQCVQWRITGTQLQRRAWAMTDPAGTVSAWRIVAENVVNVSQNVPAFVLDPDTSKGGRIVNVAIVTQTKASSGKPVRISAAITGRNTQYGYPNSVCNTIPPA
jgi:type II secretory pathway pseudopilin PulG